MPLLTILANIQMHVTYVYIYALKSRVPRYVHSKNRWVEISMKGYFNLKMHVKIIQVKLK